MLDPYNRDVSYMRISVTDRCNLRCKYCINDDTEYIPRENVVSKEKIIEVVQTAVSCGFRKFRLTGGEPLVRPDILEIVSEIAVINGVEDFGMTTNGTLLKGKARDLKDAGLGRINIHLDTISAERFSRISCGGDINSVFEGIHEAQRVGFGSLKLNCVLSEWNTQEDKEAIKIYGKLHGIKPRFIRQMNLEAGEFWPVEGGEGGKCGSCNRIRMSCDGKIYPCLFSSQSYSLDEFGVEGAIHKAIAQKPKSGTMAIRDFNTLGG